MITDNDEYVVNEFELADAARLEGVSLGIIDVLYSCNAFFDDPAAPPQSDPYADYFAWLKLQERRMLPQVELIDLAHIIDRPDQRRQALAEWQAHLNEGWETVDITTLLDQDGHRTRIVVLRRECLPAPAHPAPLTTSAAAEMPITLDISENPASLQSPLTVTFHPPVSVPNPSLNKILEKHPIAAHIREHGVEGTIEAMNSRVREAGRDAYDQRKSLWDNKGRPITSVPLLR